MPSLNLAPARTSPTSSWPLSGTPSESARSSTTRLRSSTRPPPATLQPGFAGRRLWSDDEGTRWPPSPLTPWTWSRCAPGSCAAHGYRPAERRHACRRWSRPRCPHRHATSPCSGLFRGSAVRCLTSRPPDGEDPLDSPLTRPRGLRKSIAQRTRRTTCGRPRSSGSRVSYPKCKRIASRIHAGREDTPLAGCRLRPAGSSDAGGPSEMNLRLSRRAPTESLLPGSRSLVTPIELSGHGCSGTIWERRAVRVEYCTYGEAGLRAKDPDAPARRHRRG
jgi:hypothetical protein